MKKLPYYEGPEAKGMILTTEELKALLSHMKITVDDSLPTAENQSQYRYRRPKRGRPRSYAEAFQTLPTVAQAIEPDYEEYVKETMMCFGAVFTGWRLLKESKNEPAPAESTDPAEDRPRKSRSSCLDRLRSGIRPPVGLLHGSKR